MVEGLLKLNTIAISDWLVRPHERADKVQPPRHKEGIYFFLMDFREPVLFC